MCIKVNVTYHGPSPTLSPTSNVVFKLGPSTPWASWAPIGLRSSSWLQSLQIYKISILIKLKTLQQKLTAHMPYLNFTTHCKKAHDTHHAMTFICKHSSHKHKTNIHIYNHIYGISEFLKLSQAV